MTKKEIVKTISEEIGMTQLVTKEIVQKTFDAIIETLCTEGRIELRNFGVFEVKKRKSRKARNPKTGDPVEVSEKFVVTFKPGKEMEERVRTHGSVPSDGQPQSAKNAERSDAPQAPSPGVSPVSRFGASPSQDGRHQEDGRRPEIGSPSRDEGRSAAAPNAPAHSLEDRNGSIPSDEQESDAPREESAYFGSRSPN